MAAVVLFKPTVVRVTGGGKIFRHFQMQQAIAADRSRTFRRRFPMAKLRAATPKLSGRTARSLRLVQREGSVELRGHFVANLVRFNRGGRSTTVADQFRQIARGTVRGIR